MSTMARLLVLGGALRRESWNQRIAEVAGNGAAAAGADVDVLRLADFPMPLFDQDDEQANGPCPQVLEFRTRWRAADGFILGVPEYNGALPGALKNAIDWLSRPQEGFERLDCFGHKACGLVSASPGGLGGIRGLPIVRTILSGLGMHVLPEQVAVGGVQGLFDKDGTMTDAPMLKRLHGLGASVADMAAFLQS